MSLVQGYAWLERVRTVWDSFEIFLDTPTGMQIFGCFQ